MSTLQHGLTPKMKPLSPNRSALVAALDVGTSKIACLIARLKPNAPQDMLRRRSHSHRRGRLRPHAGARHEGRRGDRSRRGGSRDPPSRRSRRARRQDAARIRRGFGVGRAPGSELISASVDVAGAAVAEGDIARVLAAGSRHSVRPGRAVLHSLPIGYALDDATGIRDPRGMLGVASASTCTW